MGRLARYGELVLEGLPAILIKSSGESFLLSDQGTLLKQKIRSFSEVDDASGLTALLQKILVLEPIRRPDVSDTLDDPWFVGSSSPVASSGSASD